VTSARLLLILAWPAFSFAAADLSTAHRAVAPEFPSSNVLCRVDRTLSFAADGAEVYHGCVSRGSCLRDMSTADTAVAREFASFGISNAVGLMRSHFVTPSLKAPDVAKEFVFQLSSQECDILRSQIVTSNSAAKIGLRRCPYAFTEQGTAVLSSVLNSDRAISR
jgi:hypothetical protein